MKDFQFFKSEFSFDKILKSLKTKPASHWDRLGEDTALKLFNFTHKNVPAYRKYLKKHKINPNNIRTIKDFKKLPVTDRDIYLKANNFTDLIPSGNFGSITTFSATSGSTGEPFYFPRAEEQDWQYRYVAELFLKNQFGIDNRKTTLGVIGFGFGIWIGGIFTYKNFNKIAKSGNNLSLVPVGPNIPLFISVVKKFGHLFDQVILMGYPPFIKDVIDEGPDYGVRWKDYNLKILTSAEGYSEKFRDYLTEKASIKNPFMDMTNIYGTVEIGTMAHETPLSILIRKIAVNNKGVFCSLFPQANRLPTFVQYHPYIVYFEEKDGEILASGHGSSIPLLRYRFPDMGGVIPFDIMVSKLKGEGIDIFKEAKKYKIADKIIKLPFVYVYERSDNALILRGANIFPDEIKNSLHRKSLESHTTGKFTMIKKEDKNINEYWEINVELKKNVKAGKNLAAKIQKIIVSDLRSRNSEFNDQYQSAPKKVTPEIILWPYKDCKYFEPTGKQKWCMK